jgi:hypothetical protein
MVERAPFKTEHCCEVMSSILERGESALYYESSVRLYLIREVIITEDSVKLGLANRITHCPWCATKLPEPLNDTLEEVLEKEYHMTGPWTEEAIAKLPKEFLTDKWWKKRGL